MTPGIHIGLPNPATGAKESAAAQSDVDLITGTAAYDQGDQQGQWRRRVPRRRSGRHLLGAPIVWQMRGKVQQPAAYSQARLYVAVGWAARVRSRVHVA